MSYNLVRQSIPLTYQYLMRQTLKNVWRLTKPYWMSPERKIAWLLLFVIISLNLGEVYINVLLNQWNNSFYNALQAVDKKGFIAALIKFSWLALSYIIVVVYKTYLNQMLQIRWRRWLTGYYQDRWLGGQNYYRMQLTGNQADNPDQRISDDVGQFVDLTLGLSLSLLSSVVTLFSFMFILWNLSGTLVIPLGPHHLNVPGYMVWAALLYAILGTWLTVKLGRPLIGLNFSQQKFEADFRFALVRIRENSEQIALYKGEGREDETLRHRFTRIFDNYWQIMKRQKTLTWFTSGYFQIATIFPFVVAAPRFFAKKIQLGGLMQTASAFGQVQGAFSYFVSAFTSIATWKAVVDRLDGFTLGMDHAVALTKTSLSPQNGDVWNLKGLNVSLPDGKNLFENFSLQIGQGARILLEGQSGRGKSTLFRTFAGIWPYADGVFTMPKNARAMFLPQKPYLPLGDLRDVLSYPLTTRADDETLQAILVLCRLPDLQTRLDDVQNWSQILSLGEQQRIAVARVLLIKPDYIFLDEATAAVDDETSAYLYNLLQQQLPKASIVSIGHRPALREAHGETITL